MENIQDTVCGRMPSEPYPPTKETTLNLSLKQLSELKKKGSRCLRLKITDGQKQTYIWEKDGAQVNSGFGITKNKALALVAQDHGNHPAVLHAAGFSTEHSAKARSIGYEEEISPTLKAGVVPAALSVENHPTDGRVKIREDGKCQTLCSRAGTGGNNVPKRRKFANLQSRWNCSGSTCTGNF